MLRSLQLLLPALFPSWGFFDVIQPSPRIQYRLQDASNAAWLEWQEWRPRPARLPAAIMTGRLLWNARWNETLYALSCAERLAEQFTRHSEQQILQRIANDWHRGALQSPPQARAVQFRLLFVERQQQQLVSEPRFVSAVLSLVDRS